MKKFLILLIIVPVLALGQSQDQNYLKTTVYKSPQSEPVSNPDINIANIKVDYFDGLGKPIQQVLHKQSSSGNDIIIHNEYDGFGRQEKDFLPYANQTPSLNFDSNAEINQSNYYANSSDPSFETTSNPFSQKIFDGSPLNRVLKQAAPGESWKVNSGHEIKFDYDLNLISDEIFLFEPSRTYDIGTDVYNYSLNCLGYYKSNSLYKSVIKNENWSSGVDNTVEEYKDNLGRIVLKRTYENNEKHDTYYVYDAIGNLVYVMPPLASDSIAIVTSSQQPITYFNQGFSVPDFLIDANGNPAVGGGGMSIIIENNTIRLNFSAGFNLATFDLTKQHQINTLNTIPDMTLGFVDFFYGGNHQFVAKMQNGKLLFEDYTPNDPVIYTTSLPGTAQNLTQPINIDLGYETITSSSVDLSLLAPLCYQYKYDHRNRLVEKKLPGKQWEYIVYNNQDMPVATGPAKSPWGEDVWGWMVTKYDVFGRVAYTGWIQNSAPLSSDERLSFQNNLNISWYEQFKEEPTTIDGIAINYTNSIFPQSIKLLTVNYYDTYSHTFQPTVPSDIEGEPLGNVKSLPTTNWVRVLTTPAATTAEITHSFYDKKGSVIGTEKFNYLGGFTKTHSKLDFLGKPLYTVTYHKRRDDAYLITVHDKYVYTPQERLLTHTQVVNNQDEELIAKNEYDELGQLISKQVGGNDVANLVGLQKVDYKYNIRGWLKEINNIDDLQYETDPLDLFAFKINYDEVKDENGYHGTKLFNGNISETYWRTSSDDVLRKYGYQYDDLNRLKNAVYQKPNATWPVTHMYDESLTYDKNGNIISLKRNGDFDYDYSSTSAFQIDDLKYTYDLQKKNQLMKVTDQVPFTVGFKDGTNTGDDYGYDVNGNMTRDKNKGIEIIKYNHLNLPVEIIFGTGNKIEYLYNAVGQKVRKTVTKDAVGTVTDYLDGFQYTDAKLSFFPHAEGYVKVTLCEECQQQYQVRFNYVYNYTDHLGNIRLSYGIDPKDEILKIMEENHYYPFGLKHTNYNGSKLILVKDEEEIMHSKLKQLPGGEQVEYKYKYNGKEYQDELGLNMYDYGARNYDAAIGRWGATDNKAEFYFANSPYVYALNTPTNAIDPDGNLVIFINGLGGGGANYWRNYDTTKDNWLSQPNKVAFDLRVSDRLNDQNRRYYDGSPGTLLHNLSSSNRYSDGYAKGKAEAAAIIGSLARDPQGNITETIKIITHSMGGVYGKGFVKALKEYIKNSKDPQVRKALITLVADFDPFQAGSKLGKADSNTYTQQFINEGWSDLLNAGWLANQEQEGADEIINNKKKSSHFIETFVDNISNLQEGTYTWDKDKEEWICTTCN